LLPFRLTFLAFVLAALYPHEEDWCWWMWCSLCIDLFPLYCSEYFSPSSILFLTIFWTVRTTDLEFKEINHLYSLVSVVVTSPRRVPGRFVWCAMEYCFVNFCHWFCAHMVDYLEIRSFKAATKRTTLVQCCKWTKSSIRNHDEWKTRKRERSEEYSSRSKDSRVYWILGLILFSMLVYKFKFVQIISYIWFHLVG